ncbi:MAG: hypothetical protein COB81_03335 [Flavobacteriaceae bacterium]|nr:MAG: hypothetical protein COB81_03335 [Flavobacteriaceae bacterium]
MELKNYSFVGKMNYFCVLNMPMKRYSKYNFFKHTYCVFKGVELNKISDKKANYTSKSGSSYFYTLEGVFRLSNHWGRAANCRWRIENSVESGGSVAKLGYADWTSFYADTSDGELYFIAVDFTSNSAEYHHVKSIENRQESLVKTSGYTLKRMREIKEIFEKDAWLKYMDVEDEQVLRENIVLELIRTEKSLREIKLAYR